MLNEQFAFWTIALVLVTLLGFALAGHFSSAVKERRRRRNHRRVVSRSKRPAVSLNVRTGKA